jgi:hypothetical protein
MATTTQDIRRAQWLRTLRQWHWIGSAMTLIGLLLFSLTGITLNHVDKLDTAPKITQRTVQLPAALQTQLATLGARHARGDAQPGLPAVLETWSESVLGIDVRTSLAEWSDTELYLSMQRPGGDSWLSISLRNGAVKYQHTDRGWIAYLNDLHKGRYTGAVWAWFIDIVAVACLVFAVSGLLLLQMQARLRPGTWPLVGLGLLLPVLITLLFMH